MSNSLPPAGDTTVDTHPRQFRFRNVRIAWSVAWGIVAVLLCVLWLRSYWWSQMVSVPITNKVTVSFGYFPGICGVGIPYTNYGYKISTMSVTKNWQATSGYQFSSRLIGTFVFDSHQLLVPYWFAVLSTAGLSTVPWLPFKRFSLRTLLIATTLVAVVLGLTVWAARN